jgi:hypothetical protein
MEERGIKPKRTNARKVFEGYVLASAEPSVADNDNWRTPRQGFHVFDPPAKGFQKPKTGESILDDLIVVGDQSS